MCKKENELMDSHREHREKQMINMYKKGKGEMDSRRDAKIELNKK